MAARDSHDRSASTKIASNTNQITLLSIVTPTTILSFGRIVALRFITSP